MTPITFSIPGEPIAKGRARAFVRGGHVAHYTPEKTARYENLVKLSAQQAMAGRLPEEGAVAIAVQANMSIPASWSKRKQEQAEQGLISPTKRPDLDNILKAVTDGANGVVWRDDAQVVGVAAAKRYSRTPSVQVTVMPVKNGRAFE